MSGSVHTLDRPCSDQYLSATTIIFSVSLEAPLAPCQCNLFFVRIFTYGCRVCEKLLQTDVVYMLYKIQINFIFFLLQIKILKYTFVCVSNDYVETFTAHLQDFRPRILQNRAFHATQNTIEHLPSGTYLYISRHPGA